MASYTVVRLKKNDIYDKLKKCLPLISRKGVDYMYVKDDPYASYKLLAAEFEARKYSVTEELCDDGLYVTYTSPAGRRWRTRAALLHYPGASEEVRYISRHKQVAYDYVHQRGFTIPETVYLQPDEALDDKKIQALFDRHARLIVKPSNSSLSRGLTLNITNPTQLQAAVRTARTIYPSVVVQEQAEGEEMRFIVLQGKVVAALLRQTPRVIGDGVSSIAELIEQENAARKNIPFKYVQYPQLTAEMVDADVLHDARVPGVGEVIELSKATMIKRGCSVFDKLTEVHETYIAAVERLCADIASLYLAVDLFVADYTQPLAPKNHWFIEFNTAPVLKLLYGCRDGRNVDIVPMLVNAIDQELHADRVEERVAVGSFEQVILPDFSAKSLVAKIDTGAYSGALHAPRIRKKVDENGRPYVSFAFAGDPTKTCKAYDFYVRRVRSAHGHMQRRYVIRTYIDIQGRLYETDIGLTNRTKMRSPILIGRKFLRDNNILVDVRHNESMDYEKEVLG